MYVNGHSLLASQSELGFVPILNHRPLEVTSFYAAVVKWLTVPDRHPLALTLKHKASGLNTIKLKPCVFQQPDSQCFSCLPHDYLASFQGLLRLVITGRESYPAHLYSETSGTHVHSSTTRLLLWLIDIRNNVPTLFASLDPSEIQGRFVRFLADYSASVVTWQLCPSEEMMAEQNRPGATRF